MKFNFFNKKTSSQQPAENKMMRAYIYNKNFTLASEKKEFDFFLGLNNSFVTINDKELNFKLESGFEVKFSLSLYEEDHSTISYISRLESGTEFRIIKFIDELTMHRIKSANNALDAFSVGSMKGDGYAVHFFLTNEDDIRNIESNSTGISEQMSKLVTASLLAINAGMVSKGVEMTKRLLVFLKNNEYKNDEYFKTVTLFMANYIQLYSQEEQVIINKITNSSSKPNPLNIIDKPEININHTIPNIVETLKDDVTVLYNTFNRLTGNVTVTMLYNLFKNYTVELLIEYKNKANGILPQSIVDEVIRQMMIVSSDLSTNFRENELNKKLEAEIYSYIYEENVERNVDFFMSTIRE